MTRKGSRVIWCPWERGCAGPLGVGKPLQIAVDSAPGPTGNRAVDSTVNPVALLVLLSGESDFRRLTMNGHRQARSPCLKCAARSRCNRALCSARMMSRHFARLNTNSSVTPAGIRGFVIFNSSSVIDVTIRR